MFFESKLFSSHLLQKGNQSWEPGNLVYIEFVHTHTHMHTCGCHNENKMKLEVNLIVFFNLIVQWGKFHLRQSFFSVIYITVWQKICFFKNIFWKNTVQLLQFLVNKYVEIKYHGIIIWLQMFWWFPVFIFYFNFLLLFKYNCLHFHPTVPLPTPSIPASHPQAYPLWLCPWVLHPCSLMPPIISYYVFPSPSLVTDSLFFISVSPLYIARLFLFLIRFHL